MLTSQADLHRRAREVGSALPEEQRVALGVSLILMAASPASHSAVRRAGLMIEDHGNILLADALRGFEGGVEAPFEHMAIGTTHGCQPDRHAGGPGAVGMSRPRVSSPLRAAWARFRKAEQAFSDSRWGDLMGGLCLAGITVILVIAAGVLE